MHRCIRLIIICMLVVSFPSLVLAAKTHKVRKNESLYSLARKYHVSVSDLKSANNLVSKRIKAGQVLVIPPRAAEERSVADQKSLTYKVKKGDNLTKIARKTGVSVAELRRLNDLGKKKVKQGQVLALREAEPAGEAPRKVTRKIYLKNSDLFSEKDYEQSLAELTEPDPDDQQVVLKKDLELKTDNVKLLKTTAYGFLGTRYRFGGNTRSGLDCSAFVQQVFRELDVTLPRSAREQFEIGNRVLLGDLQKGDLVFFRTYAPYASHVGIYLGGNKMIHASSRDRRVVVSSIDTPYYRSRYMGAKRISKINPDEFRFDDLLIGVEEETEGDILQNDTLGLGASN
ncbi:C40 family peptidase [Geobacter sp. DSM 9736]|uniref:C40 family peptidase n=1 Tax=Geobacter sp. DSM 9736 TaxID=1277350 RepID=UPI000B505D0B|nr:C40 family peptidase [Geobacter sp. DSM 9736]SNB46347.1 LysM domain-containing protein [Geobacter sp. DSM 9736]